MDNKNIKEGSKKTSLFLIPQDGISYICKIDKDSIIIIDSIQSSLINLNSIIVNDEYLFTYDGNEATLNDLKGNLVKKFDSKRMTIICSESRNNIIYIGGKADRFNNGYHKGEMFAIINSKKMELTYPDLPIEATVGKAIDDILLINNKMILVDNVVYPKYLFEYDISDPYQPAHIETKLLPGNGTHEHIIKGDANDEWMVLLSSTVGRSGGANHINISGKTNGNISSHYYRYINEQDEYKPRTSDKYIPQSERDNDGYTPQSQENNDKKLDGKFKQENVSYKDICLINETLYLLSYEGKVSKIDLNDKIDKSNIKYVNTQSKSVIKLIKSPNNTVLAISKNEFELIK